jgi:Fe-S-cluster containining protein
VSDREQEPNETGEQQEWYAEGLRFECTQCGNCCTGPPGYVWITEEEGRLMAEALGETEDEFLEKHTRELRGRRSLNERGTVHGFDCVFLDRETAPGKALCRVYLARPAQCRTWPFWPENLHSQDAWASARRNTPCPGMNHGPQVPLTQIRIRRDQTPDT